MDGRQPTFYMVICRVLWTTRLAACSLGRVRFAWFESLFSYYHHMCHKPTFVGTRGFRGPILEPGPRSTAACDTINFGIGWNGRAGQDPPLGLVLAQTGENPKQCHTRYTLRLSYRVPLNWQRLLIRTSRADHYCAHSDLSSFMRFRNSAICNEFDMMS